MMQLKWHFWDKDTHHLDFVLAIESDPSGTGTRVSVSPPMAIGEWTGECTGIYVNMPNMPMEAGQRYEISQWKSQVERAFIGKRVRVASLLHRLKRLGFELTEEGEALRREHRYGVRFTD